MDGHGDRATVGGRGAKPGEEEAKSLDQMSPMWALDGVRGGDKGEDRAEYGITGLGGIA